MKAKQAVVLGFLFGAAISIPFGCGTPTPSCNASNCTGCCSTKGTCVGGTANAECGKGGATCSTCAAGTPSCVAGVCKAGSGGGAGGGSAAGGGSGGGGSAAGGGSGGGSAAGGGAGGGSAAGGGAGGGSAAGGGAGGGSAAGGGAGGGSAAGGGAGGSGGGTPAACGASAVADHLLLSEVRVTPTPAEAVEIYNPTAAAIDLSDYRIYNATFVSTDGGTDCRYYSHDGGPCGKTNFDFDVRFPAGAMIGAGQIKVIAIAGANLYCDAGNCGLSGPDFEIPPADGGANPNVPDMRGDWQEGATLSNGAEDIILYKWDGLPGSLVKDVDYFVWGGPGPFGAAAFQTSKTGVPGYLPDTAVALQIPNDAGTTPPASYQRSCYNEANETKTGGNGITGHDETSENLGANWVVRGASMGVKTPGSVP